jgi:hypothetical protein
MRDFREPWLTLQGAADYWGCSKRSIQYAIDEGMPHGFFFGKPKVLASEAEPWLIATGRATVVVGSSNGAATATTIPPPDTEE